MCRSVCGPTKCLHKCGGDFPTHQPFDVEEGVRKYMKMEGDTEIWLSIQLDEKYGVNKNKRSYLQAIPNNTYDETVESVMEKLERTGRLRKVHDPTVAKELVRKWILEERLPWRTKFVAREKDKPYEKALYEGNKSSRVSGKERGDVNEMIKGREKSSPNNTEKTLHLQNAAEEIWVRCGKMVEELEHTAENSMFLYQKFPIRRRAGLNQESVFVSSTPLTMEEVTWITTQGPASRLDETMDSTLDSTFDAVSEERTNSSEDENEVTITASEFRKKKK